MKPAQLWHWLQAGLRGWGWMQTLLGLAAGMLALFNMGSLLFYGPQFPFARSLAYNVLQFGLPLVFWLRVADAAVADGMPRTLSYGAIVPLVVGTGVWLWGPLLLPLLGGDAKWSSQDDLMLAVNVSMSYAMMVLGYAYWRGERLARERFLQAQSQRAQQRQQLQAARLLAMQARVEPQFLFDSLQQVRDGIDSDAERAQQRLSSLIVLLRAMQPRVGATGSTLARERALVSAFAEAAELPALLPPRLRWLPLHGAGEAPGADMVDLPAEDLPGQASLAPMLLLPTLRRLVGEAPKAGWLVRAGPQDGAGFSTPRLRLVIQPQHALPEALLALSALALGPLREALQAVHGSSAQVQVHTQGPMALTFTLPLQWSPEDASA
jgi:hypothetical protein